MLLTGMHEAIGFVSQLTKAMRQDLEQEPVFEARFCPSVCLSVCLSGWLAG